MSQRQKKKQLKDISILMYRRKSKTREGKEEKEARVLPARYLYTLVRSLSSRNTSEYLGECRVNKGIKGSVLVNVPKCPCLYIFP